MNFTLFLNTRGRVKQLEKCIKACENTTHDLSQVEMIIKGDSDDFETVRFLETLKNRKTLNFKTIVAERPYNLNASNNVMARQGLGKYLFVLNDDAEMVTKDWDVIALEKIKQFQSSHGYIDDVIYGLTTDLSVDKAVGKKYAAFPIISSQAVQTLGFFVCEQFVSLGGESSIYRIYESVNRVVDMSQIVLDHVYHNTLLRVLTPDQTAYEMRAKSQAHHIDPFTFDVSVDTSRLSNFIIAKNNYKLCANTCLPLPN